MKKYWKPKDSRFVRVDGVSIIYRGLPRGWECSYGPNRVWRCRWKTKFAAMDFIDRTIPIETWDTRPIETKLWWDEQDDGSFKRGDGIFVFPSAGEPGSWIVGGPGFEPFAHRYFGSAGAAMQAVDAADKAQSDSFDPYILGWEEAGPNSWQRLTDGKQIYRIDTNGGGAWCVDVDGKTITSPTLRGAVNYVDNYLPPGDKYRYTDDNPKTAYGDRKCPLYLVPPVAVISEAAVFKLGARKYGAYNWREKTVSTSVYTGAMLRHLYAFMDGEDADPESGESHLAHVRACAAILIDAQHTGKLNDNRHFVEHGAAEMLAEKEDK